MEERVNYFINTKAHVTTDTYKELGHNPIMVALLEKAYNFKLMLLRSIKDGLPLPRDYNKTTLALAREYQNIVSTTESSLVVYDTFQAVLSDYEVLVKHEKNLPPMKKIISACKYLEVENRKSTGYLIESVISGAIVPHYLKNAIDYTEISQDYSDYVKEYCADEGLLQDYYRGVKNLNVVT